MALMPMPMVLIGASAVYGVTIGNVTTLSPIVVRREFGAAAYGTVYGAAGAGIGLISALGPSFFGLLHDAFDGYRAPLMIAAIIDVLSAAIVVLGGRVPLRQPKVPADSRGGENPSVIEGFAQKSGRDCEYDGRRRQFRQIHRLLSVSRSDVRDAGNRKLK